MLHVSASPRGQASESNALSLKIIECLRQRHPDAEVIQRGIAANALAPVDEPYATSQQSLVDVSSEGSMAQSERLVQELELA
ncbi:flavodoxin family protein, partial [Staphylococcus warneri]